VPNVRRQNLPPALLRHLLERIQSRKINATQLELLATWLDTEPEVPEGEWYKRFSGMTVCGEGELIKTFLLPGQAPKGKRVP
jgi:ribosomal protein S18 acetylase RimI-like enzyme